MNKKNESKEWIWWSAILGVIMLFVYLFVKTDSSFTVKYEMQHDRPGYESVPAWITVYASAALKWAEVSGLLKTLGWVAIAMIPICNFLAWKYDYKLGSTSTPWARIFLTFGPVACAVILWLAAYSSRLDMGAYNQPFDKFKADMQISDALADKIQKDGGTGNLLIKDENGKLTAWFKANSK